MNIPRPEYPRPQFERKEFVNLNGIWSYEFDFGKSGMEKELFKSQGFNNNINVPFVPESKLSGVEYTDFIESMFYHRKLTIPEKWQNRRIILNFGAVDFIAEIFINGKKVFRHVGGSTPFAVDITNEQLRLYPLHRYLADSRPRGMWYVRFEVMPHHSRF